MRSGLKKSGTDVRPVTATEQADVENCALFLSLTQYIRNFRCAVMLKFDNL